MGSLLGVCTLFQILLLGFLGTMAVQSLLLSRSDLRIEIRADAGQGDVQQFSSALQALPVVERVVFITHEQALEQMKTQDPSLAAFFEKFGSDSLFPDAIGVTLRSLADYEALSSFLAEERWKDVVDLSLLSAVKRQEERVHELLNIVGGGKSLAAVLLILACGILFFTVVELTRRSALRRRKHVWTERLIGADARTIALPFFWEATLLLIVSILVSGAVVGVVLLLLPTLVPALGNGGSLAAFSRTGFSLLTVTFPVALLAEFLLAPVFAGLGTWLGLRPSLRD